MKRVIVGDHAVPILNRAINQYSFDHEWLRCSDDASIFYINEVRKDLPLSLQVTRNANGHRLTIEFAEFIVNQIQ